MGLSYLLSNGIIRFEVLGDVDYQVGTDSLRDAFAEAAANRPVQPDPRWHLLFDIRQSSETRSSDELRGIASIISEHREILTGRCSVVAADPYHFGLARMFGAYMENLGVQVHVCAQVEEAERWLREINPGPIEAAVEAPDGA